LSQLRRGQEIGKVKAQNPEHAYEKAGRKFNDFSEHATQAVADGTPLTEAKKRLLGEVRGNFEAFLAVRPTGKPFLYWFGPTNVHRTWVRGSGKALWGIDPESLRGKLPRFLPDVPEVYISVHGSDSATSCCGSRLLPAARKAS
jgi:hypothetical protein